MFSEIAEKLTPVVFVLLFAFLIFILIRRRVRNWGEEYGEKWEEEAEKMPRVRAKILFKSISEYDRTRYPDLTTCHERKLFLDCLIDGEKKTFLCSEYMFDYVQKGETYDVICGKHWINLDRKYYPENFDEYFEELDNPDIEEESQ